MRECILVAQLIKFLNILHWHWMEFFVVKNIMLKKNNSNIILHGNQNEEKVELRNKVKIDLKSNLTLNVYPFFKQVTDP